MFGNNLLLPGCFFEYTASALRNVTCGEIKPSFFCELMDSRIKSFGEAIYKKHTYIQNLCILILLNNIAAIRQSFSFTQ
jgi:hypothetical protein